MVDAVKKYSGVDFVADPYPGRSQGRRQEKHVEFEGRHKKGDILNLFFEEFVEEHLVQPTFVMDHPIEISPLTRRNRKIRSMWSVSEFFMNGWGDG